MKVRYSRRAVADLIGIADYIRAHNPQAAEAVEKRIRASIRRLETFPFGGRRTEDPTIRMFPIGRYPYLVFYEVLYPPWPSRAHCAGRCAFGMSSRPRKIDW
jgi:plasmid stabilization system protein ParE